jgi:hypothetical protein
MGLLDGLMRWALGCEPVRECRCVLKHCARWTRCLFNSTQNNDEVNGLVVRPMDVLEIDPAGEFPDFLQIYVT